MQSVGSFPEEGNDPTVLWKQGTFDRRIKCSLSNGNRPTDLLACSSKGTSAEDLCCAGRYAPERTVTLRKHMFLDYSAVAPTLAV
jgi:hypothetical protein